MLQAETTTLETIADATGFQELRDEWDELLCSSSSNSFFLTWEWLYPWWKHLSGDRTLSVVTVRSGGRLVAIAPLASRPRRLARMVPFRSLEFLGSDRVCSDYLDLIIERGKEGEALQALGEYLGRETHVLDMANLRRDTCLAAELTGELMRQGWSLCEGKTSVCPFITLSGHSWESYLATLGSDHRQNFQRRLKNATKKSTLRFEPARSPAEAREALAELVVLHNMRWRERGGSDAFDKPDLIAFHQEVSRLALDRGWLRLFRMTIDARPVALLYGFRYDRTVYFVQSGFDPAWSKHSVGLLAMGLAIKSAIEEGAGEYDLLRGGEPYKFHWARESRDLGRIKLYPPRLSASLYKRAQSVSGVAKTALRYALGKTVSDRIAIARRRGTWRELFTAQRAPRPDES